MSAGARNLAQLLRKELERPTSEASKLLAAEIQRRIGPAAAAVIFYGSCLRKQTSEGVLDFYVVVDDWRSGSPSRWLAWAGSRLPPNVFYVECDGPDGALRAKYAVLSIEDFQRGTGPDTLRTGIWARFCQPAAVVWARDEGALEEVVRGAARSILTAVKRVAPLLEPAATSESFWQRAFRETYAMEMRPESDESIASLYHAAPERYDGFLRGALAELEADGALVARSDAERIEIDLPDAERRRVRHSWRWRRPFAKIAYASQLVKTAFTFGEWLPYALWKLERHSGERLVPTERQLRHPLIFGWPLLVQALRRRALR